MKQFFEAIQAGRRDDVIGMLDREPGLLKALDGNGLGPYTAAKYSRQDEIASLLLDRGVDLDIFAASMAGKRERVADLLASQADLKDAHSHDGWTALHLAAFFGHKDVAEELLARGASAQARSLNAMQNTPLHAAAANRNVEIAEILIANGADVNARQHGGWTPLHAAAHNGDAKLAGLLIALGAKKDARADNNQTPLDLALTKGHQELADLLDEQGEPA